MSVPDIKTAVATRQNTVPFVRDAAPADYPAIRDVVIGAYRQYAGLIARDIFSPCPADLLDLETHARHGRLLVVKAGAVALYERLGYRRAPEFDFDMAARFSRFGAAPIRALAYLRHLTLLPAHLDGVPPADCTARSRHAKQRNHR